MTTAIPREELETRYQRARRKASELRKHLRHANRAITRYREMWGNEMRETQKYQQAYWEATRGAGYRYGWEPKPVIHSKVAWAPTLIALIIGLLIGHFT
jgi:hypothetical protein